MRVETAFSRLLDLRGVWVRDVSFEPERVRVEVALRRRRLICPECEYFTRARKDTRPEDTVWRHLDLGVWRLEVHCRRRRLWCPVHGARAEGVPFARQGSEFTRDFECLVAWLAARTDKTTITRMLRIDWGTVGRIIKRVCADELDPDLALEVPDPEPPQLQEGSPGVGREFNEQDSERRIGERAAKLAAISMDMGPGYAKSARNHAPQAIICIDPYHVVQLANKALDEVRRAYWNELRQLGDQQAAKRFKDARWSLLKKPTNLTDQQATTLRWLKTAGGEVWRGYTLKEATRGIFERGLTIDDVTMLIDRLTSRLARSRLEPFVRFGKTVRKHRDGILAAVRLQINQGRTEALNNKVRLITRRAYGFHSANAALALVMLTCGPINLQLPHEHHSP